ncbi:anti-sigma factor [Rhizobium sp. LC145]|jgi:anti-sigma factor RsiW|uniref:anti-sigma factor family protein n=1 Tax=Rhizobium sp. LC145 TaxID=1120688 RepID=UPI00062A28FF|nr:anti-sigma factor [Rhizobium sp. LC145]KKX29562.1 hypothetical protein YH62_17630 [Rhizobium sp. LC145]TKT66046.1 anti-sigma factor [Rhizobiaceae bacterium LC148]
MTETSKEIDIRLSTFIDGEIGEEERHEVEALLVNDPQARASQDALKRGRDFGRHAFDEMLKEPVPLDLVRAIKTAPQPRRAVRLPQASRPNFSMKPTGRQALACGLLLFVVGGAFGYMLGAPPLAAPSPDALASVSENRDWLEDVAAHYRLYSRQGPHLAELPAGKPADILDWLTTNTGVAFRIPDLGESGLAFQGARLFSAAGIPAGQLFYKSAEGEVIAIVFTKSRPTVNPATESIRDDIGVVSWSTPLATYAIVGPSSNPSLDEIAAKAAGLI